MKTRLSLFLLFLFAGCASSTAVMDKRTFRCEPGQDLEIRAGVFDPVAAREGSGPMVYKVEVANNSHSELTVTYVRIQPTNQQRADGSDVVSRTYDKVILPGKDHVFEIPVNDVWVRSPEFSRRLAARRFPFSAIVALSNGDSYHCEFESVWQ